MRNFFESILEFKKEGNQNTERKTANILQTSYILILGQLGLFTGHSKVLPH